MMSLAVLVGTIAAGFNNPRNPVRSLKWDNGDDRTLMQMDLEIICRISGD